MRTHNYQSVKEYCRSLIPSIMQAHRLEEPQSIKTDELGWVNPVYFVNSKYVIRFNARDVNLPKIQRESVAYKLMKDNNIPVPDFVLIDQSKTISKYDYMITKVISGENIENSWSKLSKEQRYSLAFQAGKILRAIHSINNHSFGDLADNSPLPQTRKWSDYLESKLKFHLDEARDLKLFENDTVKSIWTNFSTLTSLIDQIAVPCFAHVDFHFGNMLYEDNSIKSILDFEWSFWGDPLYDLCQVEKFDDTWPDSKDAFKKGYGILEFDENQTLKIKLYQMIRNIELAIVAKRHFSEAEAREYLETTIKQIESSNISIQKTSRFF